jgi:CHAD domain-containing protein
MPDCRAMGVDRRKPRQLQSSATGHSSGKDQMTGALTEKWIQDVSPSDRTSDVAVQTLPGRLCAVLYYLPLAAENADEDLEHVHQLRVWTRRATAALRLYKDLIPRRRYSWMEKQLKRVRRAANDARDCDVLIERLKKKQSSRATNRWLEAVRAERAEAQTAIVAVYERLCDGDRFKRRIDKLLERVHCRGERKTSSQAEPFGEWARAYFRPVVDRFFAAVPAEQTDEAALHQFRICGKQLRYNMELLAGAFPDEFRTRLYPTIEAMQDRLGEINDLATAKSRLREKIEAAGDRKEAASWRRLLTNEQVQLNMARQQFWEWCIPPMLRDLREGFETMLGDLTQTESFPETDADRTSLTIR